MPFLELRPDFTEQAACRGVGPEDFFPGQGDPTRIAKAICATCPVMSECLEYALETGQHHGIWGGTSERERRRLRRRIVVAQPAQSIGMHRQTRELFDRLAVLSRDGVDDWTPVADWPGTNTAASMAKQLRDGTMVRPVGRFEFRSQRLEAGGSRLLARFLGYEERVG